MFTPKMLEAGNPLGNIIFLKFIFIFLFLPFLGLLLWHMEVPRLGVELELQLPAYATAMRDPSHICDLHHNSQQCQILNPLSEARDGTCNLMDTSWTLYC